MTPFIPGGLRTRTTALVLAGLALTGVLAACGGGGATTSAPSDSVSASPTGSPGAGGPGGGPGGAFAGMDMQAVRSCLSAAGITMPAFPSRTRTGTARPTFSRDPNFTGRPSGTAFPGGGGRGGFMFNDPQVKAALEACGITVPTFTPRNRPSVGTASPSS